jgi:hypothetical protein
VLFVYNSIISWRRLFMWYVQICRSWTCLACMNWKVALRKEISALSVLEVCFVLFILYTEYVALHSSFWGKSSVFTKWPVVHLQWSIHNAKVLYKYYGPNSTIQLKWGSTDGRHCSYYIIITFFCNLEERNINVKDNPETHATLDTRHTTKTNKMKNKHRKLKIYKEPATRKK